MVRPCQYRRSRTALRWRPDGRGRRSTNSSRRPAFGLRSSCAPPLRPIRRLTHSDSGPLRIWPAQAGIAGECGHPDPNACVRRYLCVEVTRAATDAQVLRDPVSPQLPLGLRSVALATHQTETAWPWTWSRCLLNSSLKRCRESLTYVTHWPDIVCGACTSRPRMSRTVLSPHICEALKLQLSLRFATCPAIGGNISDPSGYRTLLRYPAFPGCSPRRRGTRVAPVATPTQGSDWNRATGMFSNSNASGSHASACKPTPARPLHATRFPSGQRLRTAC